MNFIIRRATKSDIPQMSNIEQRHLKYHDNKAMSLRAFEQFKEFKNAFVASNGKRILGFISVEEQSFPYEIWITMLAVRKQYWRKGIGGKLVRRAEQYARQTGGDELWVGSYFRYKALGFYRKMGYKKVGVGGFRGDEKWVDFKKNLLD